ncbi:MAG: hypothetical protein ABIM60_07110 [candidate division WOR-3 bacterium]
MKKLIVSLPFLIYYCIAPVNYDKAGIKKGPNFYRGINSAYIKGRYTPFGCNTSFINYEAYGIQVTAGGYHGFDETQALGGEVSAFLFVKRETKEPLNMNLDGYVELFCKLSNPMERSISSVKLGINFPYFFKGEILYGFPNPEKLTLTYSYLHYNTHSFTLSFILNKNTVISAGCTKFHGGKYDFYNGYYLGIGIRE